MGTESVANLLDAGFMITVMGLGTVFVLLTLLVFVVQAMSFFCAFVADDETMATGGSSGVDPETVSVISAAIARYRKSRNPQR